MQTNHELLHSFIHLYLLHERISFPIDATHSAESSEYCDIAKLMCPQVAVSDKLAVCVKLFGLCHLINLPPFWHWAMLARLPVLAWGDGSDNKADAWQSSWRWRWNSLAVIRINAWIRSRKMRCHNVDQLLLLITCPVVLQVRDWCAS